MDIHFDDDALRAFADQAARQVSDAYQAMLDKIGREYRGRPIEEIKPALASAWADVADGQIVEPDLTTWSEAIRDGVRIELDPQPPEM